jgi:hypothetical protein
MGYAYLAARFKMPNMAHGYDYLGAEIVVPAIKQAAIATGVNWDPKKQIGVHASAKIRITKMISIPLMANVYVRTSKEEFLNHDYSTGKQYVENSKEGYRGFDVMAGIEVFFPASDD